MSSCISILGSTGSIGRQVCSVVRRHKDKFKIESLVANSSAEAFLKQAEEFRPSYAVLADERAAAEIKDKIPEGVRFAWGEGAAAEAVSYGDTAFVAATGFAGLKYTLKAIELKKDIALANKETLVCEALPGLYPCGEGAGYAGGIMTAAVDGVRCAAELMKRYKPCE